jgi:hypothetical protein
MNIDTLKEKFKDFLRSNYFEVEIEPPKLLSGFDTSFLKYLVVSCDFPFETINKEELVVMSRKFIIGSDIDFDPIAVTFLCDSDGKMLSFFNAWKTLIIDDDKKMGYFDDYTGKMTIRMIDRKLNTVFETTLSEVYPASRNNISLSYNSENSFAEKIISFQYVNSVIKSYAVEVKPEYNPLDVKRIYQTSGSEDYSPLSDDFMFSGDLTGIINQTKQKVEQEIGKFIRIIDLPGGVKIPDGVFKLPTNLIPTSPIQQFTGKVVSDFIKPLDIMPSTQPKTNPVKVAIERKYQDMQTKAKKRIEDGVNNLVSRIFKF